MKAIKTLLLLAGALLFVLNLTSCQSDIAFSNDSVVIAIGSEPDTLDPTKG